jgi:hypothetical protein
MTRIATGAADSAGALHVSGTLGHDYAYAWSGIIFFPATQPMSPVDASSRSSLHFQARGTGMLRLLFFSEQSGQIPSQVELQLSPEWKTFDVKLSEAQTDKASLKAIGFSGTADQFSFDLDNVALTAAGKENGG